MKTMLLMFMTLNGNPVGPTEYILPVSDSCRSELNYIKGINQVYEQGKTGMFIYASCEPVKIK